MRIFLVGLLFSLSSWAATPEAMKEAAPPEEPPKSVSPAPVETTQAEPAPEIPADDRGPAAVKKATTKPQENPQAKTEDSDAKSALATDPPTNSNSEAKAEAAASEKPSEASPVKATSAVTYPRILTRVVGEVGEYSITSREIQINDAIEQALSGKSFVASKHKIPSLTDKEFSSDVTTILFEWVVYLEAQSFAESSSERSDLSKSVKRVTETWEASSQWKALEVSPEEIKDIVNRKLVAKDFIRLKTDSSLVPVTDAEAQAYFKKNRLKFGNLPYENFRDNIKAFLIKQQTDRRLKDWFEVLQRKYKVRNYLAG